MVDTNKTEWKVGRYIDNKKGKKIIEDEIKKRRNEINSKFNEKGLDRRKRVKEGKKREEGRKGERGGERAR